MPQWRKVVVVFAVLAFWPLIPWRMPFHLSISAKAEGIEGSTFKSLSIMRTHLSLIFAFYPSISGALSIVVLTCKTPKSFEQSLRAKKWKITPCT